MDFKTLASQIPGPIGGATPAGAPSKPAGPGAPEAAEFRQALDRVSGQPAPDAGAAASAARGADAAAAPSSLKFSAHAVERMRSRGISFSPETMKGIENAVTKAAQKGSKDTLVLAGDSALIVSVKNNVVVTVMDKNAMRENVFTNIDSASVV